MFANPVFHDSRYITSNEGNSGEFNFGSSLSSSAVNRGTVHFLPGTGGYLDQWGGGG